MTTTAMARRRREAGMVAAAARVHAAEAAGRVEALLAQVAPGGEPFGLQRLQEALGSLVDETCRALEVADDAHLEEERNHLDPRERRDRATAELHRRLVAVRAACESVYGPGSVVRVLGLRGRTARHLQELRLQARRVIDRLRDAERPLPAPSGLGLAPDAELWASELEPFLADLEAALHRVHRDRRARESTLVARHEALARFDRTQSAVRSALAALYRLANLDHYEERLRPKRRRPRRGLDAAREAAEADAMAFVAAEERRPSPAVPRAAAERGPSPQEVPRVAAESRASSPDEPSSAAEIALSTPREPLRAVADGQPSDCAPPAALASGSGDTETPPAIVALDPSDFSAPPTPLADDPIAVFAPSATSASDERRTARAAIRSLIATPRLNSQAPRAPASPPP
jgi:hypothetical protein